MKCGRARREDERMRFANVRFLCRLAWVRTNGTDTDVMNAGNGIAGLSGG